MTEPSDCCSFFGFDSSTFTVRDAMRLLWARVPAHVNQCGCQWPIQRMCDPLSTKDPSVGLHRPSTYSDQRCQEVVGDVRNHLRESCVTPRCLFFLLFLCPIFRRLWFEWSDSNANVFFRVMLSYNMIIKSKSLWVHNGGSTQTDLAITVGRCDLRLSITISLLLNFKMKSSRYYLTECLIIWDLPGSFVICYSSGRSNVCIEGPEIRKLLGGFLLES